MKIKQIALFHFLLLLVIHLSAQPKLDSLLAVWEDATNPNSTRAQAFSDYIYEGNFNSNPDSAILLANQLYEFTQDADYKIGSVDALSLSGYTYFRMGEYLKALDAYQRGLKIAKEIDYKFGAAGILERIGFIYHDNADLMMALNYYQRSLKIFEEIGDKNGVSSIYNEYGSIYLAKMEYAKSLEYFEKALAIGDELNDEFTKSATYLNKGQLHLEQEDFQRALDNFQKGLRLFEEQGDKLGIASGLAGVADIYAAQGDNDLALEYYQRSLSISEQIKDIQGITASLLSIAAIYTDQGEYSESIKNCKRSLVFAKDLVDIDDQLESCYCLYDAYRAQGNMNKALEYLEQVLALTDSIKEEESGKKLQQMEFTKQVLADSLAQVEKDLIVEMEHKEEVGKKDKNRNLAIGAGIFFLLLSGGFYSRWRYVKKSKAIIEKEKDRSENLLLNILPAEIAEELKEKGQADARDFDLVSILFTDFKGFTQASEKLTAQELIGEINDCFKAFDNICVKFGIEKIKTIGDAYMAAGGLPVTSDDSAKNAVLAALEMQSFIINRKVQKEAKNEIPFEMRVGIHTGPVVAGIVGVKKFQYDIWGDTVNIASRMESAGAIEKVNISQDTYELINEDPQFIFEARGKINVKGKGELEMYFVTGRL